MPKDDYEAVKQMEETDKEPIQSPEQAEWYREEREYRERTDKFIDKAEQWYYLAKERLSHYDSPEDVPIEQLLKMAEVCCQIAKARGLRNGLG